MRVNVPMRWGLIPAWWKKAIKDLPATFNARAETVSDKPMFRTAFKRSRCIVPASGYYEWKTINGAKQPFYFSAEDGGVLSIAGLWDEWNDRSSPAGSLLSCTLIVTVANEFAGRIHNRMPVFLKPDNLLNCFLARSISARSVRRTSLPSVSLYAAGRLYVP
jgi:putative SOS response-associated peptidase YedK